MSRVGRVTETGERHVLVGRVLRWLRVLRDDLWTARADPLPPSVWLRWLPHGLVCLIAFATTLGNIDQMDDRYHLGAEYIVLCSLAQGAAVALSGVPYGIPFFGPVTPFFALIGIFYWSVHRPESIPAIVIFAVGVLALALHSIASLAKLYSEQIESIDPGPIEAITASSQPVI